MRLEIDGYFIVLSYLHWLKALALTSKLPLRRTEFGLR